VTDRAAQQWFDDLRDCIQRCVALFEERFTAETRQGDGALALQRRLRDKPL
jgi:hypothetical protein